MELKRITNELKKPPTLPKDAAELYQDQLKKKCKSKKHLVNNSYLSDVQFKVGKKQQIMYGHKLFLMTSCSYFLEELESEHEMILQFVEPEIFMLILNYCYTDEIKLDLENGEKYINFEVKFKIIFSNQSYFLVFPLMAAAKLFQLLKLTADSYNFVNDQLNADNVIQLLAASAEANYEKLNKRCLTFIGENEDKVFGSVGFREISLPTLITTLKHCNLGATKNAEIVDKWNTLMVKHDLLGFNIF